MSNVLSHKKAVDFQSSNLCAFLLDRREGKPSTTDVTFVRFLSSMCSFLCIHFFNQSKSFITNIKSVRKVFLSYEKVYVSEYYHSKCLTANITFGFFYFSVCFVVTFKGVFRSKHLTTNITFVRFLSCIKNCVCL
jgi:hypothetical protein